MKTDEEPATMTEGTPEVQDEGFPVRPVSRPEEETRDDLAHSSRDRPALSVIVLTLNEEENIAPAVRSLLDQEGTDLEVIVVDSASRDRTIDIVRSIKAIDPRLRLYTSSTHLSIGEARNIGLHLARADRVGFMSADATAGPGWARAAVEALEGFDVVYGRQEHTPARRTPAAAVRGMRYHHFQGHDEGPAERFASNVNAAMRKRLFHKLQYVDDPAASALDDILFTKQAQQLGYKIGYRRDMLVRHKDTTTIREELTKNRREGHGWGLLASHLGIHRSVLAWGTLLALGLTLLITLPHILTLLLFALVLYLPTLRRAAHSPGSIRHGPLSWTAGMLMSPLFDLAFLGSYFAGLLHQREGPRDEHRPQGA